jgi:hypothetical protein
MLSRRSSVRQMHGRWLNSSYERKDKSLLVHSLGCRVCKMCYWVTSHSVTVGGEVDKHAEFSSAQPFLILFVLKGVENQCRPNDWCGSAVWRNENALVRNNNGIRTLAIVEIAVELSLQSVSVSWSLPLESKRGFLTSESSNSAMNSMTWLIWTIIPVVSACQRAASGLRQAIEQFTRHSNWDWSHDHRAANNSWRPSTNLESNFACASRATS